MLKGEVGLPSLPDYPELGLKVVLMRFGKARGACSCSPSRQPRWRVASGIRKHTRLDSTTFSQAGLRVRGET